MTVGPEVDGNLLDKVTKFQKEIDERENSNVNVAGGPENSPDANVTPSAAAPSGSPAPEAGNLPADPGASDLDGGLPATPNAGGIEVAEFLETNKASKQDLFNQLLDDPETSLTIKNKRGKDVKTNYSDLKANIERGRISQAKLDTMSNSEEMEFGTVMAAAKAGDKEAQKRALDMIKEFSGKDSIDDAIDDLEEVKGDFDPAVVKAKRAEEEAWDEYFPETLKNSVDYQDTLDKMDSVLKRQIPAKVYDFYTSRPETKRIMYELVAQDSAQVALDAFFEKYDSLSSVEQTKLDTDPAAWGTAFNSSFESLKRQRTKAASENAESTNNPPEIMDSVSSGSGSRTRAPAPAKSYLKMSSKEFAAEKARLLSGG